MNGENLLVHDHDHEGGDAVEAGRQYPQQQGFSILETIQRNSSRDYLRGGVNNCMTTVLTL